MVAHLSDFDRKHLQEILSGEVGSWFSADLMRLIAKADDGNKELLRQVFPDHVKAYEEWYRGL